MAIRYTRGQVAERIQAAIDAGKPVILASGGNGLLAKCAEIGGADLVGVFSSSRFRLDGLASSAANLPFGNSNDIVLELGERHVLPIIRRTPVIAGICCGDPTRDMDRFLRQLIDVGFSGVMNYPTVGRFSGSYRRDLDVLGLGFPREVEVMARARELDMYTLAYAWNADDAREIAAAGVDVVIPHSGLTSGGAVGATETLSLEQAAIHTQTIIEAARQVNPNVVVLAHGGPIEAPEDLAYILSHTDAQGFVGASSMERLPLEGAVVAVVQEFKALSLQCRK